MINKTNNQIDLEFGKGDICIAGGCFKDDENKKVGLVTFIDQEPREIGIEGIVKGNQSYKVGDFPVIMTFDKSESIDVVIEQLKQAKNEMLGRSEETKIDITKTDIFKALSKYIGKVLNDKRVSEEIRCEWFDDLMNSVEGISEIIKIE